MMEDLMIEVFGEPCRTRAWQDICVNCPDTCCGCYPLPGDLMERFPERIQVPTDWVPVGNGYVMPMTPDWLCPFLARPERMCVIYPDRPAVCRLFGEIPELPCPQINPGASQLAFDELLRCIIMRWTGLPAMAKPKGESSC